MYGNDFGVSGPGKDERSAALAEARAWNSFFQSGKVEDYIRYAQLKHREDANCAAGVPDAGKNAGVDH